MGAYDDDGEDPRNHMSRRMRHVFNDQGHAVTLILCAIVLLFVCLPLFLVDDLFYMQSTTPEATKRIPMQQPVFSPAPGNLSQLLRTRQNDTIAHSFTLKDDDPAEEDLAMTEIGISKSNSRANVSASDPPAAISAFKSDDDAGTASGLDDDIAALKVTRASNVPRRA